MVVRADGLSAGGFCSQLRVFRIPWLSGCPRGRAMMMVMVIFHRELRQ
jgi:hypothetical protein